MVSAKSFFSLAFSLEPLQPLGLGDLQPAVLGFSVVKAGFADPVLAAQIGRLHPGFVLFHFIAWSFPR